MQGLTRSRALGSIGGFLAALPLVVTAARAGSREDPADLKSLNDLLATANSGVALYNGAISANVLTPAVAVTIGTFAGDHAAHRDALLALISSGGGTPVAASTVAPTPPHSDTELLTVALAFERQATGIYLTSIADFKNRAFAKTAASILGVDAGHVALLAEALRQNPAFPTSFVTA